MKDFDIKKLDNVVVAGVDYRDYPDFVDAYIDTADYDGRPLSEDECAWVTDNYPELVNELAFESLI